MYSIVISLGELTFQLEPRLTAFWHRQIGPHRQSCPGKVSPVSPVTRQDCVADHLLNDWFCRHVSPVRRIETSHGGGRGSA